CRVTSDSIMLATNMIIKETPQVANRPTTPPQKEKTQTEAEERPLQSGKEEIVEMKLPELGENIDAADIIAVLVKAGDEIQKDQGVIEIETDKATVEVPSSVSGKIVEVLVKEGSKARVGDTLIKVETTVGAEKDEAKPE